MLELLKLLRAGLWGLWAALMVCWLLANCSGCVATPEVKPSVVSIERPTCACGCAQCRCKKPVWPWLFRGEESAEAASAASVWTIEEGARIEEGERIEAPRAPVADAPGSPTISNHAAEIQFDGRGQFIVRQGMKHYWWPSQGAWVGTVRDCGRRGCRTRLSVIRVGE